MLRKNKRVNFDFYKIISCILTNYMISFEMDN